MYSAAELFHEEIRQMLCDIPNVDNLYDDIVSYGRTQKENDIAVETVLPQLEAGVHTLGKEKCKFSQIRVEFSV